MDGEEYGRLNPKSEARDSKQISMTKIRILKPELDVGLGMRTFVIVSKFGIRISNFAQRKPCERIFMPARPGSLGPREDGCPSRRREERYVPIIRASPSASIIDGLCGCSEVPLSANNATKNASGVDLPQRTQRAQRGSWKWV
jgi:hypothetical protein